MNDIHPSFLLYWMFCFVLLLKCSAQLQIEWIIEHANGVSNCNNLAALHSGWHWLEKRKQMICAIYFSRKLGIPARIIILNKRKFVTINIFEWATSTRLPKCMQCFFKFIYFFKHLIQLCFFQHYRTFSSQQSCIKAIIDDLTRLTCVLTRILPFFQN